MIVALSLLLLVSSAIQESNANSTDECSLLQDVHSCVRDENHVTNLLQLTLLKQIINQSPQATKLDQLESLLLTIIKKLDGSCQSDRYPTSRLLYSCEEIKTSWPDSPSDYYTVADNNGHIRQVYCHMEELCGSDEGWMRVAYLNMSDPTEDCPSGFRLYEENGIRACGRPETTTGYCQAAVFPTSHISYTEVCGRMIGYQYGQPGGINPHRSTYDINTYYVEGVSLTYGSPRQHIWTFINAIQENTFWHTDGATSCPCAPNSGISNIAPPSFVGNDYFCESGAPITAQLNTFYTNDPLWDGKQCGIVEKPCCNFPGLPWFHKEIKIPTNENIEMRLCANSGTHIEDTPINFFEIYVK